MNARDLSDRADQWAENAFLKLLARGGMALALPLIIICVTWLGNTLWTMNNRQGELSGKVDVLTERIEQTMAGRYRDTDAMRDFKARDLKDSEQDRRLDRNESRIDRLENTVRSTPLIPR